MAATDITFNSYNLNDGSTTIASDVDDSAAFERRLSMFSLARANGAVITDSNYGTKRIMVVGKIFGSSVSDLESNIDTFKAALTVESGNLDIGYAGSTRRYVCTTPDYSIERPVRAASWASFEIRFTAIDYGTDTAATELYNDTITEPTQLTFNVTGSAPEQFLRIEVTMTTITPDAVNTITIENPSTGETMTITRTYTQGEVLEIDCKNHSVAVDGTEVDYEGAFPSYAPGTSKKLNVYSDFSVASTTDTITASGNWTAPVSVSEATVQAWGAGGAGGGATVAGGGAGGGGGAYASSVLAVVPSTAYPITIGAGGTGSTGAGTNGGQTTFNTPSVIAAGGAGGGVAAAGAAGAGGTTAASTGTTEFAGGNGAPATSGGGGSGGGESGGPNGAGSNGATSVSTTGGLGGTGHADAGDGGAGSNFIGNGNPGIAPGGGGGGGHLSGGGSYSGGAGARGEVRVTYNYASFTFAVVVDQTKLYV